MNVNEPLRLGVIGLSEGNGHPYSWSAIFNGYDAVHMQACPFPVIPEYLNRQNFPEDSIPGARVTHIWTQDLEISKAVARASHINTVVEHYEDMIGEVDAILLARDDPSSHLIMGRPFLQAGLPVYIDKPIATTLDNLDEILACEQYPGQVFSCSALRYAEEFSLSSDELNALGEIQHIDAVIGKGWETYGIHLIDPVLNILGLSGEKAEVQSIVLKNKQIVIASWGDISANFVTLGHLSTPIVLRVYGTKSMKELVFSDSFLAFKRALEVFVDGVTSRQQMISHEHLRSTVSIIERGMA